MTDPRGTSPVDIALRPSSPNARPAAEDVALDISDTHSNDALLAEEYKLPKFSSLAIIIASNVLLQMSFFVIIATSNEYAHILGGSSTFSGVVIGIPTVFSAIAMLPLLKYDRGRYKMPLHVCCGASIAGHVLYACAYRANFLYLILIGRMVSGLSFTFWMYNKRYCSDARIVGIRRRTTLASFLVMGQGLGMSFGPFASGLLFKIGFHNRVFNGFTSPGWIMAVVWAIFWVCVTLWYEDVPEEPAHEAPPSISGAEKEPEKTVPSATVSSVHEDSPLSGMSFRQWGVVVCMCWFAMTCFFILGAWEANLAVFGAATPKLHWSPFAAGNFIALGGITAFPFLLLNLLFARTVEDRKILALGASLGLSAHLVFLALLKADKINYGSLFMCWWAIALGFNLASTAPVSLLSKQLPPSWNGRTSLIIQYSYYTGRVTGAIWGGSGVRVGMMNYAGVDIAIIGIGCLMVITFWKPLKANTG